ncbi:MAG TPA: transposase [Opitutus sp.]|nr:transposase [Opitutus sp.]
MKPLPSVGASLADARPTRRTDALHYGRVSLPAVRYFATFVTHERKPWLPPAVAGMTCSALDVLRAWHAEGDRAVLAATIMPDHVHVLFQLGTRLTVGQCVGRSKSVARKNAGYEDGWQRDFWEHRLRADESAEDYALYIFLNPIVPACCRSRGLGRGGGHLMNRSTRSRACLDPREHRRPNGLAGRKNGFGISRCMSDEIGAGERRPYMTLSTP